MEGGRALTVNKQKKKGGTNLEVLPPKKVTIRIGMGGRKRKQQEKIKTRAGRINLTVVRRRRSRWEKYDENERENHEQPGEGTRGSQLQVSDLLLEKKREHDRGGRNRKGVSGMGGSSGKENVPTIAGG